MEVEGVVIDMKNVEWGIYLILKVLLLEWY